MSLPLATKRVRFGVFASMLLALGACSEEEPQTVAQNAARTVPASTAASAWPGAALDGVTRYAVDPAGSEIYWLLAPAGAAAAAGHHHVISATTYEGSVTVDPAGPAQSRFELEFPVAAFVVDDPELRKRLGEDFAKMPSDNDIAGTRTNMLSEALLNGAMFPAVRMTGSALVAAGGKLPVRVEVRGKTFDLELPGTVTVTAQTVEVAGEFTLTHGAIGLEPFSALGGLMRVADEMRFSYRIRALRSAGEGANAPR